MDSLTPVLQREQRHRRVVLVALGALLVLSVSPVFGHHLVRAVDWLPASLEHVGPLCMVALHHLLVPVHGGFHLVLLAGLAFAAFDRLRAMKAMRGALRPLEVRPADRDRRLHDAVRRVGLPVERVCIVDGLPNPAFTVGWWTPRVFVALSLVEHLTELELDAVLAHERSHVRRRDPLRLFVWRALACTLFWLPAFRRLVDDLADEAEIIADDAVDPSLRLSLAGAILRVAGVQVGQADALDPAIGFHRVDMIDRRIRRLAGEAPLVTSHVSLRSIGAASVALMAVWASGVMVLHPLPDHAAMTGVSVHCDHQQQFSLRHLWCPGEHPTGGPCLH